MWQALVGALVGGTFALAGAMLVELRRDRRALRGAGRMAAAEMNFNATQVEGFYEEREEAVREHDEEALRRAWDLFVLHITTETWDRHGPDLGLMLSEDALLGVEEAYQGLRLARDPTHAYAVQRWIEQLETASHELSDFCERSWFDRHVLRL